MGIILALPNKCVNLTVMLLRASGWEKLGCSYLSDGCCGGKFLRLFFDRDTYVYARDVPHLHPVTWATDLIAGERCVPLTMHLSLVASSLWSGRNARRNGRKQWNPAVAQGCSKVILEVDNRSVPTEHPTLKDWWQVIYCWLMAWDPRVRQVVYFFFSFFCW
jgi:hypothetical protein